MSFSVFSLLCLFHIPLLCPCTQALQLDRRQIDVPRALPSVQVSWAHPKGSLRLSGHGDHQEKLLVLQWLTFLGWVSLPGLYGFVSCGTRLVPQLQECPDGIITPPHTTVKEIISWLCLLLVSRSSRGWGGRRWRQGQTVVLHTLR